jgi:hypothetical protein
MEREPEPAAGSRSSVGRRRQSPSEERRRGWHGHSPVLTKSNYHEWSLLMKVKLQGRRLWEAVHVGGVDYDDDQSPRHASAEIVCAERCCNAS